MHNLNWKPLLAWALAAFFVVGGIGNIFVSADIAEDYRRWGYPDWFHYVTGVMELTTAILLAYRPFRLWGAALGAAATVILHGEYSHAIAPVVVLLIGLAVGWIAWRDRMSGSTLTGKGR